MTNKRYTYIPQRMKSVNKEDPYVTGVEDIDAGDGKSQQVKNTEVDETLTQLSNEIDAVNKQDVIPVDTLPAVATADPKKIYRVVGEDSYTDYMVNATHDGWKELATYSFPGIDDKPTAGSDNLVKSGGISEVITIGSFIGNGTNWADSKKKILKGHKYKITLFNTSWNLPSISEGASVYEIYTIKNGSDVVLANYTYSEAANIPKEIIIEVPTDIDEDYIHIGGRAVSETVLYEISDVTDITVIDENIEALVHYSNVSLCNIIPPNFDTNNKIFTIYAGTIIKWYNGAVELEEDITLNWQDNYSNYYVAFNTETRALRRLYRVDNIYENEIVIATLGAYNNNYVVYNSRYTIDGKTDATDWSDIIILNKQQEPLVIQSTAGRAPELHDVITPLTFIHFSDIHRKTNLWKRLVEYINKYKNYIKFAIHTGDYCGGSQSEYTDLYVAGGIADKPILNCVGNHDTYIYDSQHTPPMYVNPDQSVAYNLLFNHSDTWGSIFGGNGKMYYYNDFADEKVRLIVLDEYYNQEEQTIWLASKLEEAKSLGYAVITASHEVTYYPIYQPISCTFEGIDKYSQVVRESTFESIIADFKNNGGTHIIHLAGHEHTDMLGYSPNGVLNYAIECATNDNLWTDAKRIEDTKTYDCFNIFSVNVQLGLLKIVRIGNNSDHYLRNKNVLSYDYIHKAIICNY